MTTKYKINEIYDVLGYARVGLCKFMYVAWPGWAVGDINMTAILTVILPFHKKMQKDVSRTAPQFIDKYCFTERLLNQVLNMSLAEQNKRESGEPRNERRLEKRCHKIGIIGRKFFILNGAIAKAA